MPASRAKILLVEDEDADIMHFKRLCRKHGLQTEIVVATSGDGALETLRAGRAEDAKFLMVTDLNMPGLNGHELIAEVRGDAVLRSNVIFVLSTSDLQDDIGKAYQQHVAGYIVKDESGEKLQAGIAMLEQYLKAVTLH